jgi:mannan endo-1,4-beta-mannosidase
MSPVSGFVQRLGSRLLVDGQAFRIAGANNYYLGYVLEPVLESVLDLATSMSLNVLRIWAFWDHAEATDTGVYFQAWDTAARAPAIHDGPSGLERLDRAVASAGQRGIRLILALTNYWRDFGGIPQYQKWFNLADPNQFYSNAECKQAYRSWVSALIQRRNTITGRLYRDEPAILAWELGNELRCPVSGGVEILVNWATEMSDFIRSLDSNHLITVGDEGYFRHHLAGGNTLFNGSFGVSCEDLLGIGAIDFGTVHLYPETMGKGQDAVQFGEMWIKEHIAAGFRANKPMLIEEYGMMSGAAGQPAPGQRDEVFRNWLDCVETSGGVGDLVWMIGLPQGEQQPFGPDGYVLSSAEDAPAIGEHARRLQGIQAAPASG